jgi:hypothetical protein
MRVVGIYASLLAAAVMVSMPASAAPSDDSSGAVAAPDKKPVKGTRKKTPKKADAASIDGAAPTAAATTTPSTKKPRGKKPKKGAPAPEAAAAPTPVAAPVPEAPPPPVPEPVATTTLTAAEVPAKTEEKPVEAKVEAKQDDGMIEVHIDAPRAVSLEKRSAESTWAKVCESPCDTKVGMSDEYRIVGTNVNESTPFRIASNSGRVVLKVDPGTPGGQTRGLVTAIASGAVLAGGVVVMLVGMKHSGNADGELSQPTNDGALLAGGAMVFAGVIGGIVGTSWFVTNAHTGVEGNMGPTVDEKGRATARLPTWNAPKQTGVPAMTAVPVFSGTF